MGTLCDARFPRAKLIKHSVVGAVETDGRDGDQALFDGLMVRILAAAPRDALPGNPIVLASVRIKLFDNRIVKAAAAEAGHAHARDRPSWPIRNVDVQQRFLGQTLIKHQPGHTRSIRRTDGKAKILCPLLGHGH